MNVVPTFPLFRGKLMEDANIIVLGIPYDSSQSYGSGSRFAVHYVRIASDSLEERSSFSHRDVRDVNYSDRGNVDVPFGDREKAKSVVHEVLDELKPERLLVIGGDHSITPMVLSRFVEKNLVENYLQLDAHTDFYETFGTPYSHACTLRRVVEMIKGKAAIMGIRSYPPHHLDELEEYGVIYHTAFEGLPTQRLSRHISVIGKINYLSIDVDVLDPSIAPEVGNPEPLGRSLYDLLRVLSLASTYGDLRVIDVVEAIPSSATSTTAITVAYILREALIALGRAYERRNIFDSVLRDMVPPVLYPLREAAYFETDSSRRNRSLPTRAR